MILSWFNAAEAESTATALADGFSKLFPATSSPKPDRKQTARKEKALQNLVFQTRKFSQSQKLNIYKKARFGQAFQRRMFELGYDEELARTLTQEVVGCL